MINGVELANSLVAYYDTLRDLDKPYGRFSYSEGKSNTYWASAYAAMNLHLYNKLEDLSEKSKEEWLEYFISGQDNKTGTFYEINTRDNEYHSKTHSQKLVRWHGSTFVNGAISILGGKLKYPIYEIHFLKKKGEMTKFLENLPWENPWLVGNYTYDIACLLGHDYNVTQDEACLDAMDEFFEWHNEHQNPTTGWWDINNTKNVPYSDYGGYHTLMAYWMYNKEIPNPDKMIKSSAAVYRFNKGSIGCCQDMDLFDTMITLSQQYGIFEKEVKQYALNIYPKINACLNSDGGSCNCIHSNFSDMGWEQHSVGPSISAPTSTLFNTYTLSLIQEVTDIGLGDIKFNHHNFFSHCTRPKVLIK